MATPADRLGGNMSKRIRYYWRMDGPKFRFTYEHNGWIRGRFGWLGHTVACARRRMRRVSSALPGAE